MDTRSSSSSRKRKLCSSKQTGEKAVKGEIKERKIEPSENTGKLKFRCNKCEKKFSTEDVLKIHEMFHSKCLELLDESDEDNNNNSMKESPPASEKCDNHQSTLSETAVQDQFRPAVISTPIKKLNSSKKKKTDIKVESFNRRQKTAMKTEKSINTTHVAFDTSDSFCDIEDLLESDDDESAEPTKSSPELFAKDDIVWEMWYKNAKAKGRVKDCDLNTSPPLVIAQVCLVTSVKKVEGKGVMVGLLPVPTDGKVLDTKLPGYTTKKKFVRKFGTLVQRKLIENSQRYREDFQTVMEQVDCVERYMANHVGLEIVPREEIISFREYLGLEGIDKCIYLEGIKRLKRGLNKEIPRRGDSFEESLEAAGIYDHVKRKTVDLEGKKSDDTPESEPVKVEPSYNDESYIETLDEEMLGLVSSLPVDWPLEWMRKKQEIVKLKKIMTGKKKSRRHELFIDSKQRTLRRDLPELIKISNPSFMNIFGKKRDSIDIDVRIFIRQNVFDKTVKNKDFDHRLRNLLRESQLYVELVLYPELFISWLARVRNCTQLEADRFYQTVGQVVSKSMLDRVEMELLRGDRTEQENYQLDDTD